MLAGKPRPVPVVLIALGSNVGDRVSHLREAVRLLSASLTLTGVSAIYETDPMYVTDQPPYLNAAAVAETGLSPRALLALLKDLESRIGRQAGRRYGPREIDLDLVAYGSLSYTYSESRKIRLQVPHPRTPERRFVLEPLADIAPGFNLPGLGVVKNLLSKTEDQAGTVQKIEDALLPI